MKRRWGHSGEGATLAAILLGVVLASGAACSLRSTADLMRGQVDEVPGGPDAAPGPDLDGGALPDAAPVPPLADAGLAADLAVQLVDASGPADSALDGGADEVGATMGTAVLVIGDVAPNASDAAIQKRLAELGLEVTTVQDNQVAGVDLSGAALVFVSKTASDNVVGTSLRALPRPVIVSDPLLLDQMAMVNASPSSTRGTEMGQTALDILASGSPLAAGLSGTVIVSTAPISVGWGLPSPTAQRIASVAARPERGAVFTYEKGAEMVGVPAPARRVGFFCGSNAAANLSATGWALFDAAVRWSLGKS